MCYLPLSFLAALELYEWSTSGTLKKWVLGTLAIMGMIFSFCLITVPLIVVNKEVWLIPYIDDLFALASLEVNVEWSGYEYLIGVFFAIIVLLFIGFLYRRKIIVALFILLIGLGSTMILLSNYVVPKIEMYSQGPAIEFYESIKDENKYVITVGYKSYAHYFYAHAQQLSSSDSLYHVKERLYDEILENNSVDRLDSKQRKQFDHKILDWMMNGEIDKTVYFVSRIDRQHQLEGHANINKLYNKGGFVFYSRTPKKKE